MNFLVIVDIFLSKQGFLIGVKDVMLLPQMPSSVDQSSSHLMPLFS
jgi:hypothetical protein